MAVNGHHATNGNTNGYLVAFPALPQPLQQIYKPGQMYKYHSKLLKRPVPPLKQTLTKYLKTLDVCITDSCSQVVLQMWCSIALVDFRRNEKNKKYCC